MTTIHKAAPGDFSQIAPLLLRHFPAVSEAALRCLFTQSWSTEEGSCGLQMKADGRVVGFVGHIFSRRSIDGVQEKFCNLGLWAVDECYRSGGSLLLLPVFQLARQGYTITDFTSSWSARLLWDKLRFVPVDTGEVIFPVVPLVREKTQLRTRLLVDDPAIEGALDTEARQLYRDHLPYDCHHILAQTGQGGCYALLTLGRGVRNLATSKFHHVSDRATFIKALPAIKEACFRHWRTRLLGVPARFLAGQTLPRLSFVRWDPDPVYFSRRVRADRIDGLYSELVLLKGLRGGVNGKAGELP